MPRIRRDDLSFWIDDHIDITGRSISLIGMSVDDEMLELLVKGLHIFSQSRQEEGVHIYLSSGGGEVGSGLGAYDVIQACSFPVTIEVVGEAESMAAILLQAAEHRIMSAHSHLMIHQGAVAPPADHVKNVKAYMRLSDAQDDICDNIILQSIQQKIPDYSLRMLRNLTDWDTYFSPERALEWGLIDEVKK